MKKIEIGGLYEPPETGPLAEMTPDQIEKLLLRAVLDDLNEGGSHPLSAPMRSRCELGERLRLATGLPTSTITRFLEIPRSTWYYHRARTGRPNELWVTDITEMAHPSDAKVYLNPAIDCFDGRSVAWSSGLRPTSELADSSLESASGTLSPGEAPAVHNDRGVHHRTTSQIVRRESHGLRRSTSRKDMSCDSTRAEDSSACSSRSSTTPATGAAPRSGSSWTSWTAGWSGFDRDAHRRGWAG